jgi:hypothetical protein
MFAASCPLALAMQSDSGFLLPWRTAGSGRPSLLRCFVCVHDRTVARFLARGSVSRQRACLVLVLPDGQALRRQLLETLVRHVTAFKGSSRAP